MLYVTKRDGHKENVQFDKITERINRLINPVELQSLNLTWLNTNKEAKYLDPVLVSQKVVASLYPGVTTEKLDIESANICVNLSTTHPSYAYLGGRILVSNLHKATQTDFTSKYTLLKNETNNIDENWYNWICENADELNKMIDYNRDYIFDYFGFKTLEKSYLLKSKNKIIERPQDMFMRTASTLQMGNLEMIKKTYDLMSLGYYTHASPTLFNCGTKHMQLSSCFLKGIKDDSLESITESWNSCAQISKWAGGIGLHVSNIRAKNSLIKGTSGESNGLVPFLRVYDNIARWIDQGGKRPGSIAIYLEPHHPDIFDFLELRKNFGNETSRARDLFQALWISDLFMKQVKSGKDWYLLSPDDCPGLTDAVGDDYESLYWKYVNEGKYREKVDSKKLWMAILDAQIETGMPYIGYKDSINRKTNQKNLGTIKSSNLCIEIAQYSDGNEYAVCNLASIGLKTFVKPYINNNDKWTIYSKPNCKYCRYAKSYLENNNFEYQEIPFNIDTLEELKKLVNTDKITYPQIFINNTLIGGWSDLYKFTGGTFDYEKLYEVAYTATINLDKVIDINYYPIPQAKLSNIKHRPVGLGIQGLADVLVLMRIPFESQEALELNTSIMETIYLASIQASCDVSKQRCIGIRQLIYASDHIEFPEYYDINYDRTNKLYHTIKPNKWDLLKNPELSSCGSYYSFDGSPMSKGQFQFDMWNKDPLNKEKWDELRNDVMKYGIRNSLLTALMPTASTSQILGNNECFEFFTNNIYTRKTHAGDFVLVNKYLVNDLININKWSSELKNMIIANDGSIDKIEDIPPEFKKLYKTIWEIGQVWVTKAALARAPYVDQTQSMNIFMAEPDYERLTKSHFWCWENGLKTGMYYLRSRPSKGAVKFTIDPNMIKQVNNTENEGCTTCSA